MRQANNVLKLTVKIVGDSPLITNKWSDKAKKEILDKQMGKAHKKRAAKDPEADFERSIYRTTKGCGFPAIAIKCAMVDACSQLGKSITKVMTRGAFHIEGELIEIKGKPVMREDMVRVGMGVADIRYRAMFDPWSAMVTFRYNADVFSAEQITNLLNLAGFAVGIGEWRPQRNGQMGLFHVE